MAMENHPSSIPHFFINLDRSPGRRAHIENQLADKDLLAVRVPGIDGAALGSDVEGIDPKLYKRCHGREIRPGEVGCYLSHLKALSAFLATDHTFAVILEDDAVLHNDYCDVLNALLQPKTIENWSLVKLQCRRRQKPWHLFDLTQNTALCVSALRSTGATAYLVNRTAARKMVDRLLPMQVPWDHAFDRPIHLGLKVRVVHPNPVSYDNSEHVSTIEVSRPPKARGLDRAMTYWWRTKTEVCRFVDAIFTYLRAQLTPTVLR